MKFKDSWLREVARFERIENAGGKRSELGLVQFHAFESHGERPPNPDPYFEALLNGKRWWEWTINYYAEMFGTAEWPGWNQLQMDFVSDDQGLAQIKKRLRVI
jgi:hypothetical protein